MSLESIKGRISELRGSVRYSNLPLRLSTPEGIDDQVSSLPESPGLIYWIDLIDDQFFLNSEVAAREGPCREPQISSEDLFLVLPCSDSLEEEYFSRPGFL